MRLSEGSAMSTTPNSSIATATMRPPASTVEAFPASRRAGGPWVGGLLAALAWATAAAFIAWYPGVFGAGDSSRLAKGALGLAMVLLIAGVAGDRLGPVVAWARPFGPRLTALALFLVFWEAVTAKFALLPRPFFATPQ